MTNLVGVNYWRLPEEMQQFPQWCLAGPDKAPYLVGDNGLYHTSPVKGPWLDFESACFYAAQYGTGIGFILTEHDPFSCIDMDVKDAESLDKNGNHIPKEARTPKQALDFYTGIVQFTQSYTELSASGKGLHVWVRGDIGAGRRGKGIEIYSRERFIACTGNPLSVLEYHLFNGVAIPRILNAQAYPIVDGSLILENLQKELGLADNKIELEEVEADLTDKEIWARATTAGNSDKFISLCEGKWQKLGFPSQSEADLALMSMFTFYSKSNEQCRRLFRHTVLGQRAKATRDDVYLDRTLQIIRARQSRERATNEHGEQVAARLMQNMGTGHAPTTTQENPDNYKPDPSVIEYVRSLDQTQVVEDAQDNEVAYTPPEAEGLDWPPGLVGAIAGFIYQSAPRPVKEVAIVAALGLMSGITGKAYNIGQTGLNLYIILIARSAIGKEAMHSGIGHILRSQCGHVISPFVNFTDYASGPALTKAMEASQSFVNVSGEWGRKLQRMAEDKRDGPMQQLRTVMTHLYQKSGAASVMGGLGYSNKDLNVASVNAVAYSMIGETTPGTFYDSLTQTMMEDGFLSRFNIIEYLGERPPENKEQMMQVPDDVSRALASIASHAVSVNSRIDGNAIQVKQDDESHALLDGFNHECDDLIREAGTDESIRQIWNRAHLKAVRVAGVLAASDNHITPVIRKHHAEWAISLVKSDTSAMLTRVKSGDIGVDDTARFRKVQTILIDFLQGKVPSSYNMHEGMIKDGIVPRSYLQRRTRQVRSFLNYRLGSTLGLDHTIKTMIDSGYLMEVNQDKAVEMYGYHGRCFRVLDIEK